MPDLMPRTDLLARLASLVGESHVSTDEIECRFFSHDIAGPGVPATAIVAPGTVEELAAVVGAVCAAGHHVVARGGGASYTGGYTPDRDGGILVDTRRLDRVVAIDADNMYVTVECGCTWQTLLDALAPHERRTPFWGPLSGGVATIGGSLSQHAILWGSARYGVSAESVLGLDVVLADGRLVSTGSGGVATATPFFRYYGPDLTGLFLGDAGALGVKARATLRLVRWPTHVDTASFAFDDHHALTGAMTKIARDGLVSECFGMDPVLQRQRMKRAGLAHDLKALKGVATSAGGVAAGFKAAARVALAGRRFLDGVPYSMHLGTEGRDEASVAAAMRDVRRLVAAEGGREVENTIPKVLRGSPFVPLTSAIGPEGERWLPVHGLVPLAEAAGVWDAVQVLFAEHDEAMTRLGVEVGVLTAIVSTQAFVIEPVFYWPAPRTPYYERVFDRATLDRFTQFPDNPEADALVRALRADLTSLLLARGATHLQIGRTYRYREGLRPTTWDLVATLKRALDPHGTMNPGALGLCQSAEEP